SEMGPAQDTTSPCLCLHRLEGKFDPLIFEPGEHLLHSLPPCTGGALGVREQDWISRVDEVSEDVEFSLLGSGAHLDPRDDLNRVRAGSIDRRLHSGYCVMIGK